MALLERRKGLFYEFSKPYLQKIYFTPDKCAEQTVAKHAFQALHIRKYTNNDFLLKLLYVILAIKNFIKMIS